ncbi:hypothetical protein SEA_ANGELIQUE_73 [Gordonia phage Angelique]|nr:hypothetical protein SEA_ANGELIQUE_73 [Gordonia phage Angelique]
MTESDGFFLDRHDQRKLREKLATIPSLIEDVVDVMSRQSVRAQSALGRRPRKLESRLPLHIGAADAATRLRNSLILAVRHTCEYRGIDFMPVGYTHPTGFIGPLPRDGRRIPPGFDEGAPLVTAKWLWRNVIAFALTEGSPEFAEAILDDIAYCESQIDRGDSVVVTPARRKSANRKVVTVSTIDTIAKQLGDEGEGLNARRLRHLANKGLLKAQGVDSDTGTKFYNLGDVLAAHKRIPWRERPPRKGRAS